MKRLALGGAALLLLALAAPWHVGAQEAVNVTVSEVGWWSSQPTALPQPDKGFQVAAGQQGDAQSIAALRLAIPATHVDSLQVRLVEAQGAGAIGSEFGTLRVCTTLATWKPANPGAFADAPKPDCTVAVNLTRTTDNVWLGDLTPLAPNGGDVSLMITPVYQPPTPVGPGMTVTIGAGEFTATGSSTTSTTAFVPDSGGGTETTSPPPTDYFGGSTGGGGSFGVPSGNVTPDFGTTTTAPPPTSSTTAPADDFALQPIANAGVSKPWIRLILLLPLCGGFGVGVVYLRRFAAERGLLGG